LLMLVVGGALRLTIAGVVVGLLGAYALTRLLGSLLFGVSATDPATYGGVAAALLVLAAIACAIPALKVIRTSPAVVLRQE